MQSNAINSTAHELDPAVNDLGPLAWVLEELRKSLDGAAKALKRFVRDADAARGSDLAAVDASQLRLARQQLHQAVGALEMVGLAGPALVLRSMEAAVQKFVQQPGQCTQEAASKIERASFALMEYLQGVLADKHISAVSLFPQYRDVQELVRADRIHPADLWANEWRWIEPQFVANVPAQVYGDSARSVFDQSVLQIMKGDAGCSAAAMRDLTLGFSAGQIDRQSRIFWLVTAAYFEALAHGLIGGDIYVRRAASRILLQYLSLSKGSHGVSERLAQDLLFFCAQAVAPRAADTPVLSAVREAYGLSRYKPVDYEAVLFGRFDPATLAQALKRIASAKETWSSLSAGDTNKYKVAVDQFTLVTDSLVKLHAPSEPLANALLRAVEMTANAGRTPAIELAMEVATSVLYLEAAFDDLDPRDTQFTDRTKHLAERLESVRTGGQPQPLESWMEELYRRVSDKQTMGSVVGELRVSLGELEKSLDQFFRNTQDKTVLRNVPSQLSQMRGVLSVLGLEQAAHAVLRMRDSVEQMLVTEVDQHLARAAGTFDTLGNNLGALSFLIDMLNYQPALAKKLFVFDDAKGELKPLMGRMNRATDAAGSVTVRDEAVLSIGSESAELPDSVTAEIEQSQVVRSIVPAPPSPELLDESTTLVYSAVDFKPPADLPSLPVQSTQLASVNAPAVIPAIAPPAAPAALAGQDDFDDFGEGELLGIFLEEAREVTANGQESLRILAAQPDDIGQMASLRRVFHTLKGSSRMVGLNEFGDAGWSLEQLLNTWLADQKPANDALRQVANEALAGFSLWIEDIAAGQDADWLASSFMLTADALRTDGKVMALVLPARLAGIGAAEAAAASSRALADNFAASDLAAKLPQADAAIDFDVVLEPAYADKAGPELADATAGAFDFEVDIPATAAAELNAEPGAFTEEVVETTAHDELLFNEFDIVPDVNSHESADILPAAESSGVTEFAEITSEEFEAQFLSDSNLTAEATIAAEAKPAVEDDVIDSIATAKSADETHRMDEPEPAFFDSASDEQIKVIGDLRIGIPLYNVYLNEADEWSRRLVTDISEWAIERQPVIDDSIVGLAHSLAGSSATVGFDALSEIARALEHALQNSQNYHRDSVTEEHEELFVAASEDIRRLLHQFAAGFLKSPDSVMLQRLKNIEFAEQTSGSQFGEDAVDSISPDFVDSVDLAVTEVISIPDLVSDLPESDVLSRASETDVKDATDAITIGVVVPYIDVEIASIETARVVAQPQFELAATNIFSAPVLKHDFASNEDDEIDAVDAIDAELFPIFEEEAAELVPQLGTSLRQWSARPTNQGARMEVLRALHTLKGSARLAGALRLGEMAHRIESEIEFLGSDSAAQQDFEPLLVRFDALANTFEALRAADAAGLAGQSLTPLVEDTTPFNGGAGFTVEEDLSVPVGEELASSENETPAVHVEPTGSRKLMVPAPQSMSMQPLRQAATASIRVKSQLLDRMVNQAGEVMITRSRLEVELSQLRSSLGDMNGNLNRLRQQLRDIELQAETQMQSRLAQAKELQAGFDPLEFDRFTRVQELTRMMAESVNDVATVQRTLQRTVEATEDDLIAQARQTRELQRDLLRTRMVEFEGISDRLYRVVRQASKETGKQVKLDLLGGTIEMDRGMLDRMTPAFEHLLRNCVAHGIESPEVRSQAGKDPAGLITVHLRQEGNDVSVDFSDDGAGLDLVRIREKAVSLGLIEAEQILSEAEAANLIFLPGFSTASQVTELAGRGIGMDVVRSEVNSIGGRIETSTVAGSGTHFKLVLPLTTAVTQVVMVRAGSLSVGVPANVVEIVRRTTAKDLQQAYNTGFIEIGTDSIPFFWSGALLQASHRSTEAQGKTTPVVVFRSAAQRIALHVDEVLGKQEVVVKNLGPQLSRLPGLTGMSVLASGAVVLIYNPVALASIYGEQARALSKDSAEPHMLEAASLSSLHEAGRGAAPMASPPQLPLILVVDDSITVRRVTQRLLQREGYRVVLAADGLQALERLLEERPAVVLSDIEMPRMDGFDLARNIRADEKLRGLPIVMITSRIAEKHREHAKELGVDHYLGKPYGEDELMSLVRHYCNPEFVIA